MADNDAIAAGAGAITGGAKAGGWLSDLTFSVDGKAGGGDSGQGFQLSQDEARAQLEKFRAIEDRLEEQQRRARRLEQITPPAQDPATVRMNQALVGGGQGQGAFVLGSQSLTQQYKYVHEIVVRLQKALGIYQESDDQASGDMRRSGQDSGSKGIGE